ncbi:MAG: hypothetical protein V4543_00850 [Bacteroidota bacterium]
MRLSFEEKNKVATLEGRKCTTIRFGKRKYRPGQVVQAVSGNRFRKPGPQVFCNLFLNSAHDIELSFDENGKALHFQPQSKLTILVPLHEAEGFGSQAEMNDWFSKNYGKANAGKTLRGQLLQYCKVSDQTVSVPLIVHYIYDSGGLFQHSLIHKVFGDYEKDIYTTDRYNCKLIFSRNATDTELKAGNFSKTFYSCVSRLKTTEEAVNVPQLTIEDLVLKISKLQMLI